MTDATTPTPGTEAPAPNTQPADPAAPPASLLGAATDAPPANPAPNPDAPKDGDPNAQKQPEVITPESYGDFALPDGIQVNETLAAEFKAVAAEMKLTKDQAQKLVDLKAAEVKQAQEAWAQQTENWVKEVQSDPEFGGAKLQGALADAGRAMERFGSPELRQYLNDTGLGNHPELVKAFARAGRAIAEDKPVGSGGTPGSGRDARSFYSASNMT